MEKFVIIHDEAGILVGAAMGFTFWTKLDVVGQDCVTVFPSVEEAKEFVSSWDVRNDTNDYEFAPVQVDADAEYATLFELLEAGLRDHVGHLVDQLATHKAPAMLS